MAASVIKWSKGGPDCAELRKRHGPRNHTKQAGVRIASRKPTQDRRRFRERPGTGALIEQSFANACEDREKGKPGSESAEVWKWRAREEEASAKDRRKKKTKSRETQGLLSCRREQDDRTQEMKMRKERES